MPLTLVGALTVTELPLVVVTVSGDTPLMLYVNVYGAVPAAPVKVMLGDAAPLHTAVVPLTCAVGNGFTVNVIAFDVAVDDVTQVNELVITTVIEPAVVPASV